MNKTCTKHWQNYASFLFKITCTGDVDLLRIVSNGLEIIHWSWYYTRYIAVSGVSMTTLLEHSLAKLTDYRFSPKCLKFKLWIRYHKVASSSITFAVSICTRILKYRVWKIEFDELGFLSISNSNFAGYTGSKNLVQTRQKS